MEESWSSGGAPLLRTRSLPLVLEAASGTAPPRHARLDPRQLLTLTRHYYPEGGWGWGVAAAATLVQILAHGLHHAAAILAVEAVRKFGPEFRMQAGNYTSVIMKLELKLKKSVMLRPLWAEFMAQTVLLDSLQ